MVQYSKEIEGTKCELVPNECGKLKLYVPAALQFSGVHVLTCVTVYICTMWSGRARFKWCPFVSNPC
ncbi:unnamed protein product [Ectocarpus fasciculatus]